MRNPRRFESQKTLDMDGLLRQAAVQRLVHPLHDPTGELEVKTDAEHYGWRLLARRRLGGRVKAVLHQIASRKMANHVLQTAWKNSGVMDQRPKHQIFHAIEECIVEEVDGLGFAQRAELLDVPQPLAL